MRKLARLALPALRTGEAYRLLGADDLAQLSDRGFQDLLEKEEEGGECLVLDRVAALPVDGELAKEGVDILFAEGGEGSVEGLQNLV